MRSEWKDFEATEPMEYEQEIVSYGDDAQQEIYLNLPKNRQKCPIIVWYHGGGLTGDGREIPKDLWTKDYATAEVRYRTSAGENNGLDSIEDAAAACAWIMSHADELNVDVNKLFVGGMSAGAYLAAMVGVAPHLLNKHGYDYRKIAGLLIVSGQMTTHFRVKDDLGYKHLMFHPVIDELSPFYYVSAEIAPIILITGDHNKDMAARPEENAFFAETLRVLGHKDVNYYRLGGHDHGGSFDSCDYLLLNFIEKILA